MKKLFFLVLSLSLLTSGMSFAEEASVAGGFEASGHTFVGAGWQRYKTPGAAATVAADISGTFPGAIGEYSTVPGNNREDEFKFFVDEVELDLAKTLGENIRFRADLDFGSSALNSSTRFANDGTLGADSPVILEQAYATTNIAAGNGAEFLIGRFNSPSGFESVDVGENDTISRSIVYRALRPHSYTGAKLYYAFTDAVDFNFWVANNGLVNDRGDGLGLITDIPAVGFRLGYGWGEEGKQSHFGFGGAWGQEHTANIKNAWSFLGDLDWQWWLSDAFALGGEAIYHQVDENVATAVPNGKYFGGVLNFHYDFSDVWDGTFRYSYAHDVNGDAEVTPRTGGAAQSLTGADQQVHEVALAGNYAIAEGATLKLEGGYTHMNPTAAANNRHVFGVAGGFAYNF